MLEQSSVNLTPILTPVYLISDTNFANLHVSPFSTLGCTDVQQ